MNRVGRAELPREVGMSLPLRAIRGRSSVVLPVVFLVGLLAVWSFGSQVGFIPSILLPSPAGLVDGLRAATRWLPAAVSATAFAAITGCFMAAVVGIAVGALLAQVDLARRVAYPYIVILQVLPTAAIAPIFVVWFGAGPESKIALAFILSFFPVLVSTMAGMARVPSNSLRLMSSLRASRWQMFWMLTLPTAMPYIFAGLRTAAPFALLGGLVGEFVVAREGLGFRLLEAGFALKSSHVWATIVVIALLGIAMYGVVALIERRLVWWAVR